jgi:hypothetical protein
MKIKNIFYYLVILVTINNHLYSQPFVDTIYNGRTAYVDFSESISQNFTDSVSDVDFIDPKLLDILNLNQWFLQF